MAHVHKSSASPKYDPKTSFKSFIEENGLLFMPTINQNLALMGGLRLDLLPELAREIFIKWLFEVNKPRLLQGLPLLITYPIVKQCPLWKIIPMPYRQIKLNKDTSVQLAKMMQPQDRLRFKAINNNE